MTMIQKNWMKTERDEPLRGGLNEFVTITDMNTSFNARGPDGRVALTLDLGARHRVAELRLAFGHDRVYRFDILGANAPDGDWVKIASGQSDGQARSWVRVPVTEDGPWRYVRVQGLGNNSRHMGAWFNVAGIVLIGR